MKWAIQAKEEEKNKPQTFSADGWTVHKCGVEMSKNSSLPSQEQQETSELNGSGGGRGKVIRGLRPFVPVGVSNRDKKALAPRWPG